MPGDYYGLRFTSPGRGRGGRCVEKVEVFGGEVLSGVVSWDREDEVLEAKKTGWIVLTERKLGGGGWVSLNRSSLFPSTLSRLHPSQTELFYLSLYRNLDN
jgi:hypothetical protein